MNSAKQGFKYKKLCVAIACFGFLLSTPFVGKSNAAVATVDFSFTGAQQTWTVPETGSYTIEAWGAQGGNAGYNGTISTYGGKGGYASGSISLTANQVIYIYVGGQGQGGTGSANNNQFLGGYNGGGYGYNGTGSNQRGAGGGGGTDVRVLGTALSNRVLVAGGGAGGVYFPGYGVNNPGAGGGAIGVTGNTTGLGSTSFHGKGGTQLAGGAGGTNGQTGGTGSAGNGGNAVFYGYGEAGAGGGYFGGGGSGAGTAAGGGSGYVGGVTSSTNTAGNASMPNPVGGTMTGRSGNGFLRITYADAPDSTAPTFTSSSTFSAAENIATSATAATIRISESATVTISSGADAARFNISRSETNTAIIKFNASPDFEAPADVGGNNVYEITLTATDAAANAGTQSITITVTDVVDTSSFNSLTLAGSATTATYRTVVVITANVTVASKVTFRINGKILPGCKNKSTTGSSPNIVATCSWKPSNRGIVSLTAAATPTGAGISSSTATPINIRVGNRTTAR